MAFERNAGTDPAIRVPAETFVSALITSERVKASPEELAAAYEYASGGTGINDRGLTLEQLAVFAADGGAAESTKRGDDGGFHGWASWIGVVHDGGGAAARRAVVKARVKFREAALLGRPFPGEAFARLDPEGGGRISRLDFMRGLREIGFTLVDEMPESHVQQPRTDSPGNARPESLGNSGNVAVKGGQGGPSVGVVSGVLGDITPDGGGDDCEIRLTQGDEDEASRKRQLFMEKVQEIERATAEKVGRASHRVNRTGRSFMSDS